MNGVAENDVLEIGAKSIVCATAVTVIVSSFATETIPKLSVAWTLNVCEVAPLAVVPLITPVAELRARPLGSDPAVTAHVVYVPVPPVAASVVAYDPSFGASGRDDVLTVTAAEVVKLNVDPATVVPLHERFG